MSRAAPAWKLAPARRVGALAQFGERRGVSRFAGWYSVGALVISAAMREPTSFKCPTCDAAYKVVRAEAPSKHDRELTCLSCGGPLRSREGKFVLKYFRAEGGQKK